MRTLLPRSVALLSVLGASAAAAQSAAPAAARTVALDVVPDHADWQYRIGETARFTVTVTRSGAPVSGARVRIQLGPERLAPERVDTLAVRDGRLSVEGAMRAPGFLRLIASTEVDGEIVRDTATVGFSSEKIMPVFDALPAKLNPPIEKTDSTSGVLIRTFSASRSAVLV